MPSRPRSSATLHLEATTIDLGSGVVTSDGADSARLTDTELQLLVFLAGLSEATCSRNDLLREVWGYRSTNSRTLDTCVNRLRAKVERDPRNPHHIITVYGVGYRFTGGRLVEASGASAWPRPPAFLDEAIPRTAVVQHLAQALQAHRVVTVHGPGGVGKTRLASQVISGFTTSNTCYVDLAQSDDIQSSVARALLADHRGELAMALGEWTRHSPAIVFLDTVDSHVAVLSGLLAGWLEQAPNLTVCCTSRQALGVPGEVVVPVTPMSRDEGVALLRQRASELGVVWPDSDDAVLADLVQHLDGLPLALEMVAARARVLRPAEILERLRLDLGLLSDRRKTDRQTTMLTVIDWSWRLLSPDERAALTQLTVFADDFSPLAAEAVVDIDGALSLDVIQALCDRSVVASRVEDHRQRLRLPTTVAAFLQSHVTTEISRPAGARMLDHFAGWCRRRWPDPNSPQASHKRELARDSANLLASLDYADRAPKSAVIVASTLSFLQRQGVSGSQLEPVLRQALAHPPAGIDVGVILIALSAVLRTQGRFFEAKSLFAEALLQTASPAVLLEAATAHYYDKDRAIDLVDRSLEGGDARVKATAWALRADLLRQRGKNDDASLAIRKAQEQAEVSGSVATRAYCAQIRLMHLVQSCDMEAASRLLPTARELFLSVGDQLALALAERAATAVSVWQRRPEAALEAVETALSLSRRTALPQLAAMSQCDKAMVLLWMGRLDDAIAMLEQALALYTRFPSPRMEFVVRHALAAAHGLAGDAREAQRVLADVPEVEVGPDLEAYRNASRTVLAGEPPPPVATGQWDAWFWREILLAHRATDR